ncbi:MAG: acetate--CoA ligase family protein [Deltaproteobacteria bacterium]|nr:acetate--CoA ligase family protein [Deltaproteobacteria bacterium]MCZ6449839.1 acetate--CoA ligase family protein [Deltaproteobacteria bacterium]MCZ6622456.1 acetate--CoA ligase family protein [Deltaproteobacteria bacterium]
MARLLEHHALDLLKQVGVPVPPFRVVSTPEAAREAATRLGSPVVLKALIPVGGRGKAGAIRMAQTPGEAFDQAQELLGRTILNFPVRELLVSEEVRIAKEFFVSLTFDSMSRKPVVLFSSLGGIDVETILEKDPEKLVQVPVDICVGLQPFQAREIAESAGLKGRILMETAQVLMGLYRVFRQFDAQTVEVNPLALTDEDRIVAPSAVVVIDDQALFRHPELDGIADPERTNGWRPLTDLERQIRDIDKTDASSAIRFNEFEEGDIAFMITGGGSGFLALDLIQRLGGKPATTFDITPGRVEEKMYLATKAILSRPGLKGMIAGGNITNFIPIDVKVRGVVRALKDLKVDPRKFPVVFRYAGPGVEAAKKMASELPGIEFYDAATSLEDAVRRIVELTRAP